MGYTTEFEGSFKIEPPLTRKQVMQVNNFCTSRHEDLERSRNLSIWCDYQVTEDGTRLRWNGSEKSYVMDRWLPYLIERFFGPMGCKLNGEMRASGDRGGDVWLLQCVDNKVRRAAARLVYEEMEDGG